MYNSFTQKSQSITWFFYISSYSVIVMFFIRILFIIVSTILIFWVDGSFAMSGSINTGSVETTIKTKNTEKIEGDQLIETNTGTEERRVEEKKTEKNAQKIILEVYKIQGNKILKDMDSSITKVNPDPKVRIEVYTGIQKTLEFRKQKLEKSEMSNESKNILTGYIDYMVYAIEKKIKNLE